ncbi:DUF7283 family protein [Haloarcula nitratireducens]|uniref:Uncharacterized protein n=1 Tax=Haloarcula nitratireducens TaxID=2487749 RepID=A0AAW4P819_9EURY|nr:hypothetical protein [Halomicroarcula nitratireducens]MBX0293472.1 hypothetical protein [Halomicroarcula nitratireducens]
MLETHAETPFVWVALAAVSVAVLGVVVESPSTAPPDAAATAATVDEIATSPPGSVATRDLTATEWTLTSRQVGLRADGGTAHATFLRSVVPAVEGRLAAALDGRRPSELFGSPAGFRRAVERAETGTAAGEWRPAPERVTVRRVAWGGVDVTLVG